MNHQPAGERAKALIQEALDVIDEDDSGRVRLLAAKERLDEPIRVALAGRIKAGKSTLINAFLGEQVAPTDTGECTKVVTWYKGGGSPRVRVFPHRGSPVERPVHRVDGALRLDTAGLEISEVRRIEVTWPSPALNDLTLIDTPGLASLSEEVSAHSLDALVPEGATSEVDAVVYLLRHLHASDADFLSSFREQQGTTNSSATTLGVLARADEVGAGRIDALLAAAAVADRYRNDPTVRTLCMDVVPVAGLMAEGARTMRQSDFEVFRLLAGLDRASRQRLLISADRFVNAPLEQVDIPTETRARLMEKFGVFGIRLGTVLVRDGFDTATELSEELVRRSGLDLVSQILTVQFTGRADALKGRTALMTLSRELAKRGPELDGLRDELESALRDVHQLNEMRLLAELRTTHAPALGTTAIEAADRVLGGLGTSVSSRLGTPDGMADQDLCAVALGQLSEWQMLASDPEMGHAALVAARTVIRTLEGMVTVLEEDHNGTSATGLHDGPMLS